MEAEPGLAPGSVPAPVVGPDGRGPPRPQQPCGESLPTVASLLPRTFFPWPSARSGGRRRSHSNYGVLEGAQEGCR